MTAVGTGSRAAARPKPWLVALDIDGTVLREDGSLGDATQHQVARVAGLGNAVTIATGRSVAMTLPVLDRLGISPKYVVCANGAITLKRDPKAPTGYVREHVETFDPSEVLTTVRGHLESARYAVEDEDGMFYFSGGELPEGGFEGNGQHVEFEQLLTVRATRVVVISPEHAIEDFLKVVDRMGLHRVSYNVGWTAWLDIAPDGVNKAVALERVRRALRIARVRVIAMGDGRNDIDMLQWAASSGRGIAMGQAPREVIAAGNEVTKTDREDGVAAVLAGF